MALKYQTLTSFLQACADAIKNKCGLAADAKIKAQDFPDLIASITTHTDPKLQSRTVTPTLQQQNITAEDGFDGLDSVTVNAMPAGVAGTPTITKGSVSNHAVTLTPNVTNSAGYIDGGTKTGTSISVSASELVSGTLNISGNGVANVTNYASVNVNIPTTSITSYTITIQNDSSYKAYVEYCSNVYSGVSTSVSAGATKTLNVGVFGDGDPGPVVIYLTGTDSGIYNYDLKAFNVDGTTSWGVYLDGEDSTASRTHYFREWLYSTITNYTKFEIC